MQKTNTNAALRVKPDLADAGDETAALIRKLTSEFDAPAGLIDSRSGLWIARAGAPGGSFPRIAPSLVGAAFSAGRAVLWRGDEPAEVVWLLMPISASKGPVVAAVGFATSAVSADGLPPSGFRWGPVCPEPALKAWGNSFVEQVRPLSASREPLAVSADSQPASPSVSTVARSYQDGSERQIIARLIRRLRISDPPERFQQLASNALRVTMGVQAVAWIPCHDPDAVIVSGEVGQLKDKGFRTVLPGCHHKELSLILNEPVDPPDPALRRIIGVSADSQGTFGWLFAFNPEVDRPFSPADAELMQPIASLISTQQINAAVYADLKDLLFGVIRALTAAIDAKDPYTSGHSERVARIAMRLGEELGMSANQRGDLYLAGLLHDVGKIGVDDAVLKKPGPLTPDEYRQIQAHVQIGVHILTDLRKLNHLLPGVRHHHESLDGTGYPSGIAGEAIPLEARILAVADSYDAMSSTRPYRRRLTPTQIDEILRKGSGVQWDPKIIDALFACRMDLEMIRQKGLGESLQLAVSETLGRS